MSPIDIRMAIDPLREQLRHCHARAIERRRVTEERVIAKITVRDATIESVVPVASVRSPLLWHCIRGVLFQAAFKAAPTYAEVTVTLGLGVR